MHKVHWTSSVGIRWTCLHFSRLWLSSVRRADTACASDNHDHDTSRHHSAHSILWPATKSDKPPRRHARSAGLLPSESNKSTASQKVHVFIGTTVPHATRPHRICVPTLARSSYHAAWLSQSPVGVEKRLVCLCDDWSMPRPLIHTLLGGLRCFFFLGGGSGDDSQEDLAKFGYKLISKVIFFLNPCIFIFGYLTWTCITNLTIFLKILIEIWPLKISKSTRF
jgi:hypothetical protein